MYIVCIIIYHVYDQILRFFIFLMSARIAMKKLPYLVGNFLVIIPSDLRGNNNAEPVISPSPHLTETIMNAVVKWRNRSEG